MFRKFWNASFIFRHLRLQARRARDFLLFFAIERSDKNKVHIRKLLTYMKFECVFVFEPFLFLGFPGHFILFRG